MSIYLEKTPNFFENFWKNANFLKLWGFFQIKSNYGVFSFAKPNSFGKNPIIFKIYLETGQNLQRNLPKDPQKSQLKFEKSLSKSKNPPFSPNSSQKSPQNPKKPRKRPHFSKISWKIGLDSGGFSQNCPKSK